VEDHRIVVGKGHAAAIQFLRRAGDRLRRGAVGEGVGLAGLADVPVLAEAAGQVAARGAEREDGRSRQEMVQRLLLDRIDAKAARPTVGCEYDLLVLARAHEAHAALILAQLAVAGT
jgi:hypothetical protein